MTAAAAPSSGETTPARAPPGCPAHHPLDDTFDDGAHISNIESFVVSTVPLVPALDAERPAGDGGADPSADGVDPPGPSSREKTFSRDRFALRDLWAFFDEWSAYGVEVPLTLDDEDHEVFQYYVPFLSGIQLFRSTEVERSRANATNAARRDDDERDKDDEDEDENENENGPGSGFLPLPSGIDAATRKGETVPGRELVFSYFEQASPYARAPLADTAERFRADHPELFALTSDELHPASWMSVAWYPIYRIPVGQTLRDLSACFLTYHALSTAERAGEDRGTDPDPAVDGATSDETSGSASEMEKLSGKKNPTGDANDPGSSSVSVPAHLRGCPAPPPASATGEAAMASRANRLIGSDPSGRRRIRLRAFGLAYYKLRSELWRPAEVADWLKTMQGGARAWLRGQKVIHPDFEFFSHRG